MDKKILFSGLIAIAVLIILFTTFAGYDRPIDKNKEASSIPYETGIISAVFPDRLELKSDKGNILTILVNSDTLFKRIGVPIITEDTEFSVQDLDNLFSEEDISLSQIQVGDRISSLTTSKVQGNIFTATRIVVINEK